MILIIAGGGLCFSDHLSLSLGPNDNLWSQLKSEEMVQGPSTIISNLVRHYRTQLSAVNLFREEFSKY